MRTKKLLTCVLYALFSLTFKISMGQWTTILPNTTSPDNIGIGPLIPISLLHIDGNLTTTATGEVFRTDCPNNASSFWRMQRAGVQYGWLYNLNNSPSFRIAARQEDLLLLSLGTTGVTGNNVPGLSVRLRLTSDLGLNYQLNFLNDVTKAVIERGNNFAPMQFPRAMLNIGNDAVLNANNGGWRAWMDVGTFNIYGTDNMYIGLKGEQSNLANNDRYDAIISWGDNDGTGNPNSGPDNMRFIYTTTRNLDATPEAQYDGSEIARMTPDGLMGIGNFTPGGAGGGSGIQPCRRLEIYDQRFNANTPNTAPQFRLTFIPAAANTIALPNNITNTGTWTDFQTTLDVDQIARLYIHPSSDAIAGGTSVNGFVGINTATAANTLDINSTAGLSPRPSGLRFSNLNSTSASDITNNGRMLTLDGQGNVCLTDEGGNGNINWCSSLPIVPNGHISYFTNPFELCNSVIFQNWNTGNDFVGIHNTNPLYYLHNTGTSMFEFAAPSINYPTYNSPMDYPLAVKSNFIGGDDARYSYSGIGVFAEGNALAAQDNLNIFADHDGQVFHLTIGTNTYYNDKFYNEDMLAFSPSVHSTIISDDYSTNPAPLNAVLNSFGNNARLFVEGSDKVVGVNDVAVWGDNISAGALSGLNGRVIVGVGGTAIVPCLSCEPGGPTLFKIGGSFLASNADGRNPQCYGVQGVAVAGATHAYPGYWTVGGLFEASGSDNVNVGALGRSLGVSPATTGSNYGGYFWADNGKNNYGIYAQTQHVPFSCFNGAVTCTQVAGYFRGDVFSTVGFFTASDSSLKNNIVALGNTTSQLINSVNTYSYNFDTLANNGMDLPGGLHYGFMAQEVEQHFPSLVRTFQQPELKDTLGNLLSPATTFKAVNYTEFIPILWNGYQQQQQRLDSIVTVLTTMQQTIDGCCNSGGTRSSNPATIELENLASLQLLQNDPNPWSESTMVRWNIGKEFQSAVIYFYDNSGAQINQYKIEQQGKGELQVFGSKLSNGVYSYTLVVDGKAVDSKKMIKAQ